jgi:hypothetical protein
MISLPHCSQAAKKSSGDFSNAFFLCGMPAAQQPRPTIKQLLCVWDRVLLLGEVFQQQSSDKEILLSLYTPATAPAHHLLPLFILGGKFSRCKALNQKMQREILRWINATLCTSACVDLPFLGRN